MKVPRWLMAIIGPNRREREARETLDREMERAQFVKERALRHIKEASQTYETVPPETEAEFNHKE